MPAKDRKWLAAYDRAVKRSSVSRETKRAKRKKPVKKRAPKDPSRTRAGRDALKILAAWVEWSGGSRSKPRVSWGSGPKSVNAVQRVKLFIPAAADDIDAFADIQAELGVPEMPRETGRGASVKVKIITEALSEPAWISIGNLSPKWQAMADDAVQKLFAILVRYYDTTIVAISIGVTGHQYVKADRFGRKYK